MSGALFKMVHRLCFTLVMSVFLAAGCGYELEGTLRPENLKGARTISIASFLNQTNEPGLGRVMTKTLRGRFLRDGRLQVTDSSDADIALEGILRQYRLTPIGFTRADRAQEYRVSVRTRIRLRNRTQKKMLINQDVDSYAEFKVAPSIAQSAANRSNANQRVANSVSEDIVSLVLEGF